MLISPAMTNTKKRASKKGADKTTSKRRESAIRALKADSEKVQVNCVKCGASYTGMSTTLPKKCKKCGNAAYDEPARRGPKVKESQKRYARLHGLTIGQVRERFPEIGV